MNYEELDRIATKRAEGMAPAPKLEPVTGAIWTALSAFAALFIETGLSEIFGPESIWPICLSIGIVSGAVWALLEHQRRRHSEAWQLQYKIALEEDQEGS